MRPPSAESDHGETIEARLRAARGHHGPAAAPPGDLHQNIMRAVRQAEPVAPPPAWLPRALRGAFFATAATALLVATVMLLNRPVAPPPGLGVSAPALGVFAEVSPTAPLETEAARVATDLQRATDFLLAHVPAI